MRRVLSVLIAMVAAFGSATVQAHKGSDAYLDVQQSESSGDAAAAQTYRFSLAVAIKDLDLVLPMDGNADGKVTWGEVKAAMPLVLPLLNQAAQTEPQTSSPACNLDWQANGVERRSDGTYLRFAATAQCAAGQALALRYTLFSAQDATHRLLVAGRTGGQDLLTTASPLQASSTVLRTAMPNSDSSLAAKSVAASAGAPPANRWSALRDYFLLGAHHLLEGYDHMAFLLALVLPLRLSLRMTKQMGDGDAPSRNVWLALLRTVTAFTIGHSITLMLATFGWTQGSPAWVEPVIALSIGVTAALNLRPAHWLRVEVLALAFGLVHGYGFAGLLQEAAAPAGLLPWALAGFNLGVEAGQLIAVSAWVAVSQLVVAKNWYPSVVVRGGSWLLILVAAYWFWQRVV